MEIEENRKDFFTVKGRTCKIEDLHMRDYEDVVSNDLYIPHTIRNGGHYTLSACVSVSSESSSIHLQIILYANFTFTTFSKYLILGVVFLVNI